MEYGNFNRRRDDFGNRGDRPPQDRYRDTRSGGGGDRWQPRERNDRGDARPRGFGGGGGFDGPPREQEESVFSKRVRAGKRRTYFFDVRKTRGEDYFITITESTRRDDSYGYKRHKIFLYKEDFNRFAASLNEVVEHVKTNLLPDFDYEEFDRRQAEWEASHRDEADEDTGTDESAGEGDDGPAEVDGNRKDRFKEDDEMTW